MKILIRILVLIFLFESQCLGQCFDKEKANIKNDSTSFVKAIYVYTVDSCLINLLEAIVKADKQQGYKDSTMFYYSLLFDQYKKGKGYLRISLENRKNVENTNYSGIIKVRGIDFLCQGNLDSCSIFHRLENTQIEVAFKNQSQKIEDRIPIIREPLLQGTFVECENIAIYIEIYNKGKILDYEMKFK